MKERLFNTLGSEYFKKSIKENEKRINDLNETTDEKRARLCGFYLALIDFLIADLETHETKK